MATRARQRRCKFIRGREEREGACGAEGVQAPSPDYACKKPTELSNNCRFIDCDRHRSSPRKLQLVWKILSSLQPDVGQGRTRRMNSSKSGLPYPRVPGCRAASRKRGLGRPHPPRPQKTGYAAKPAFPKAGFALFGGTPPLQARSTRAA